MGFEYRQRIPEVREILEKLPLTPALVEVKKSRDREIIDIISGKSQKFLLIIGPCSADRQDAVDASSTGSDRRPLLPRHRMRHIFSRLFPAGAAGT